MSTNNDVKPKRKHRERRDANDSFRVEKFALRIRHLVYMTKLPQTEIAAELDLVSSSISRISRGGCPDLRSFIILCNFFDLNPLEFIRGPSSNAEVIHMDEPIKLFHEVVEEPKKKKRKKKKKKKAPKPLPFFLTRK